MDLSLGLSARARRSAQPGWSDDRGHRLAIVAVARRPPASSAVSSVGSAVSSSSASARPLTAVRTSSTASWIAVRTSTTSAGAARPGRPRRLPLWGAGPARVCPTPVGRTRRCLAEPFGSRRRQLVGPAPELGRVPVVLRRLFAKGCGRAQQGPLRLGLASWSWTNRLCMNRVASSRSGPGSGSAAGCCAGSAIGRPGAPPRTGRQRSARPVPDTASESRENGTATSSTPSVSTIAANRSTSPGCAGEVVFLAND